MLTSPNRPNMKRGSEGGPRLRLRISRAAEGELRAGHPWVFAGSVREQNRAGTMGELAVVYDRTDRFLAAGLFDPESPIKVRILQAGKPRKIERDWWRERLREAIERRRNIFAENTTGYRWINGESDGWPGLVLDRYADTLVLKIYTAAWTPWVAEVCSVIHEELGPERLVLRMSRNIQARVATDFGKRDGEILFGLPPARAVVFKENGLKFEADVVRGQKTGFFLDQRDNRARVELLARGGRVLNAFSFSGGFSVYAARGGAKEVTDVDISEHALAGGARNFALNSEAVGGCRRESVKADAFDWLAKTAGRKFDMVILDPPSLAKQAAERSAAVAAYQRLASLGMNHLDAGGVLVACSCSAHVSATEFFGAVLAAARKAGTEFREIERAGQPPDHPARFTFAEYLKAIYLERV
jgi:23S rRNA (cytosine1962-C5)-methyltransferase